MRKNEAATHPAEEEEVALEFQPGCEAVVASTATGREGAGLAARGSEGWARWEQQLVREPGWGANVRYFNKKEQSRRDLNPQSPDP